MAEYDNTNRGVLFRETEKKNERGPDYTGKMNVGGTEYRLSAWIKEGKSGNKFMSLSIDSKPIAAKEGRVGPNYRDAPSPIDDDWPLPF